MPIRKLRVVDGAYPSPRPSKSWTGSFKVDGFLGIKVIVFDIPRC